MHILAAALVVYIENTEIIAHCFQIFYLYMSYTQLSWFQFHTLMHACISFNGIEEGVDCNLLKVQELCATEGC